MSRPPAGQQSVFGGNQSSTSLDSMDAGSSTNRNNNGYALAFNPTALPPPSTSVFGGTSATTQLASFATPSAFSTNFGDSIFSSQADHGGSIFTSPVHSAPVSVFSSFSNSNSTAFPQAFVDPPANNPFRAPSKSSISPSINVPPASLDIAPNENSDRLKRFNTESDTALIRDKMKKERDDRETRFYANYKPMRLEEAKDLRGTCADMCPEFERYDREVTQELHFFEMVPGTENTQNPRCNHAFAVKKYRRSAAGKDPEIFPEDIRPPLVLKKTMDYLVSEILERKDQEFIEIYNFIRDRGRALRKDFKVQNHLKGEECVYVLEKLTRFLIHADFVLCEMPETRYSWKQNRHQIFDTLTTLMEIYDDDAQRGIYHVNESEFRSYYILLTIDDPVPVDRYQSWLADVQADFRVQIAVKLHCSFHNKNFRFFFQQIRQTTTTYLMGCLLHLAFEQVRKDGFKCLSSALMWKEKPVSVLALKQLFGFDDTVTVVEYCKHWGLDVEEGSAPEFVVGVRFGRRDAVRSSWIEPANQFKSPKSRLVSSKLGDSSHTSVVNGDLSIMTSPASTTSPLTYQQFKVQRPSQLFKSSIFTPLNTDQPAPKDSMSAFEVATDLPRQSTTAAFKLPIIPSSGTSIQPNIATPETTVTKVKHDYTAVIAYLIEDLLGESTLPHIKKIAGELALKSRVLADITQETHLSVIREVVDTESDIIASLLVRQKMFEAEVSINISSEFLEFTVQRLLVEEIVSDALATITSRKSIFRYWFGCWRRCFWHLRDARVHQEELKRKRLENLRQIPLVLPSTNVKRGFIEKPNKRGQTVEISTLIEQCEILRKPLDLPELLFPVMPITLSKCLPTLLKLLICVPDSLDSSTAAFFDWIVGKLRIGGVSDINRLSTKNTTVSFSQTISFPEDPHSAGYSSASTATDSFFHVQIICETLCFFFAETNGGEFDVRDAETITKQFIIMAQKISKVQSTKDPSHSVLSIVRNPNSTSINSGTTGILFLVSLPPCDRDSLESEKCRLWTLLASLPRYSCPPLLVMYLVKDIEYAMSEKQFTDSLFKGLELDRLIANKWISQYRAVKIGSFGEIRSSIKLLEEGISWLAIKAPRLPELNFNILESFLYGTAVKKFREISEKLCSTTAQFIKKDRIQLLRLLNGVFELVNSIIQSLITIINSNNVPIIAWPASELSQATFSTGVDAEFPPIEWNSPRRLREVTLKIRQKLMNYISIPSLAHSGSISSQIYDIVKDYLMSMAKINHKIATNSRLILANFGGLLMGENISGLALFSSIDEMVIPVLNSIREEISGKTAALKKDVYQEEQAMVVTMYCVMNRTMDLMRQEWTSNKVKRKVVENTAFDAG